MSDENFASLNMNSVIIREKNVFIQTAKKKNVKTDVCVCVRTLLWQSQQLSDYCPPPFVEWPWRMWWEWPLGKRLWRDKDYKREWERDRKSERHKEIKRGRTREREKEVREPADVKVPPITSCFSSTPSLALSLSVQLVLSFPLKFLSQRFTPLWRRVLIGDNNRDASVRAHTSAQTHKFIVSVQVKSGPRMYTSTHT